MRLTMNWFLWLKEAHVLTHCLLLGPEGGPSLGFGSASYFFLLSHLICQPQSYVFWAWSRVKAVCIDGREVSTSASESVGPGSITGGRKSDFFHFVFLLEVIKFFFSSFQRRMIYQNKSEKL